MAPPQNDDHRTAPRGRGIFFQFVTMYVGLEEKFTTTPDNPNAWPLIRILTAWTGKSSG